MKYYEIYEKNKRNWYLISFSKLDGFICTYFSTYLWLIACLAVSRLVGSMANSALTKSLASAGVSANNSSMLGFEFIDFDDWFNRAEPKPFPTDFKSLSLASGSADTMHSIYNQFFLFDFLSSVIFYFHWKIVSKNIPFFYLIDCAAARK